MQSWKFSKVKLWPKPRIQNSANTNPLNLEYLTQVTWFIFTSWLEKCFELTKISKNSSVKETGPSYGQKFVSSDNPSQNIWYKVKKYSKIGQEFKNVISNYLFFLTALSTFNFWNGDWALGCVSSYIWYFSNIF